MVTSRTELIAAGSALPLGHMLVRLDWPPPAGWAVAVDEAGRIAGDVRQDPSSGRWLLTHVRGLLNTVRGRVTGDTLEQYSRDQGDGLLHFAVELRLMDPMRNIRSVALLVIPRSAVHELPRWSLDGWGAVSPDMRAVPLALEDSRAVGSFTLVDPGVEVEYVRQARLEFLDGRVAFSAPSSMQVRTVRAATGRAY